MLEIDTKREIITGEFARKFGAKCLRCGLKKKPHKLKKPNQNMR